MSDIKDLLNLHPSLELINDGIKIRCNLTGHEMPSKVEIITAYIQGKKYKRLRKEGDYDFKAHEQHIVPSFKKGHEHQLFCRLTFRHISKEAKDVERHVNGRRYKRALKKYEECQKLGIPFKPNKPKKPSIAEDELRKRERWMADDGERSSDEESVDSLSDLYPAEFFPVNQDETIEEDSDDESTNEEIDYKQPKKGQKLKLLKRTKNHDKSMEGKQPKRKKMEKSFGKKAKFESKIKKKPKIKK